MPGIDLDTWLISDTHFFHKNIGKFCDRPDDHNQQMMKNWASLVGENDTILHLGDIFMGKGSKELADKLLPELPGKKYFIYGNHDHETINWYKNHGFSLYTGWDEILLGATVRFSHYPETTDYDWDINIHGHIHNNGYAPGTPYNRDYRNISVEVSGYRPWRLEDVLAAHKGSCELRKDAAPWNPSKIVSLYQRGRLDEHFCEIDRSRKF